jgi:hypothetical protein
MEARLGYLAREVGDQAVTGLKLHDLIHLRELGRLKPIL